MEPYTKGKENNPTANIKRASQAIKNNAQISQSIRNKLCPLNSVHRSDLYFKMLRKQANKNVPVNRQLPNRDERYSIKLITRPDQFAQHSYKLNQMEIFKETLQKDNIKKRSLLSQNIQQLIRRKSQQSESMGNSQFKYERLPRIKQELEQKKKQFIEKTKKQFMEIQFADRDERNYSFQYMVKKAELYKKTAPHERQASSVTVYQKNSPNKLKNFVNILKQQPKSIKKAIMINQSRKLIRLPNSQEQQEQQKQFKIKRKKKKQTCKLIKNAKQLTVLNNQTQENSNMSLYTSKLRVTQNRRKFLDMEFSKKSRSNKYEPRA